jgi:hypothetical protein
VTGIVAFGVVVLFSFLTPFLIRTIQKYNQTPDEGKAELMIELEAMKQLDASEPAVGVRVNKTKDP